MDGFQKKGLLCIIEYKGIKVFKIKQKNMFILIYWFVFFAGIIHFSVIAQAENFKPLTTKEAETLLEQHRESLEQSLPEDLKNTIENYKTEIEPIITEAQKRAEIIKQNNFLSGYKYYSDPNQNQQKEEEKNEFNGKNTELIIFVSSSMGIDAIREYISDADKSNSISSKKILLRGFVDGAKSVQPTINFLHRLTEGFEIKNVEIEIDPTMFRKYKVDTVPAFIIKEVTPGQIPKSEAEYRVQGHISLTKVFEILEKKTNEKKYGKIQNEINKNFFF